MTDEMGTAAGADKATATRLSRTARPAVIGGVAASLVLLQNPAANAQDASASATDGSLDEIVVTARKQQESVIDVPESITAFSDTTIKQLNIQSFDDYAAMVPNLSFNVGSVGRANFSNSRGVTIRGVVGSNTTSMYIDDTPIPISQDPRIVDVQRIEVLKGPQGTLYGSSAIGGTIRIITKQPSLTEDDTSYMLQGGFTEHGGSPDFGANAIGNFVLIPNTLAVRAMGFFNHDAGFVTRVAPVSDGSDVMQSYKNQGEAYQYGGSLSTLWQISDPLSVNFKLLTQREEYPNGWPVVWRGNPGFDPTSLTVQREYNVPEWSVNDWTLPALTIDYKADKWDLVSSTSYYERNSYDSEDVSEAMHQFVGGVLGYNNFGGISGGGAQRELQFQEEDRLTFKPTEHFNGLVGAYYADAESLGKSATRATPGIAGADTIFGIIPSDVYFQSQGDSSTIQKALFGELSYKLGMVDATAGLRKYWINQPNTSLSRGYILQEPTWTTTHTNITATGYSPKFSINVEPSSDTSFYGSAAKGFRPGGPGSTPLTQCLAQLEQMGISVADYEAGYKSDSVWTYEVGAKKALQNQRFLLTGAVFQTDWTQIQQTVSLKCGVSFTGNAGAARIRGTELEFSGNLTDHLAVHGGFGYTDAVITNDANGTTNQAVGSHLYDVPKDNAALAVTYTQPLSASVQGFLTADWSYTGSSLSTNNNSGAPGERGAYSLVNLRLGYRKDNSEVSLYVDNLFNKLADLGDHVPDISANETINGVSVPMARISVSTPLTVGLQYRHGL